MNATKTASRGRCLLTWLLTTAAAAAVLIWASPDLAPRPRLAPFDTWLTWLCAWATALCAVWGWVVTTVVVLEAGIRRPGQAPARGVPTWLRRLVLGACGVAVLGSAVPAVASGHHASGPDQGDRERHSILEGLPLPDRAEGPEHRSVSEVVARTFAERAQQGQRYAVRPGDSLWLIAETHWGDPTRWPELYALNRDLVGPDPDLIRPGQLLRLTGPTFTEGDAIR